MKSDDCIWLKEVGLDRQFKRYDRFGCLLPGLLWILTVLGLVVAAGSGGVLWWPPVLTAGLAMGSGRYARRVLFHSIVCPHCGHNPTRRKSDGVPRKDEAKLLNQLRSYRVCPGCGDENRDLHEDTDVR